MRDISPVLPPAAPHTWFPSPTTTPPSVKPNGTTVVHVPICRREESFYNFSDFVPRDNPVVFSVEPTQWHRIHQGVYLFRYTDFRGWPAVQPAASEWRIKTYFQPLTNDEGGMLPNSGGRAKVDWLLLEARWWCCWAQGFTHLEPELRWVLTLIFDLVGVLIAQQKAATSAIAGSEEEWMRIGKMQMQGRYYLAGLVTVVKEMKETFGIENLYIPHFPWFARG
ncbi:uncharacterized protein F4822DRAFT_425590 [Hypoxylon trugodes]|uniref:uncharacterized protein n=1 Tax=Hypoxylon trugodes TaxID=326681 RepID=UPI0021A14D25|nr:uncharacterized protein F4822DRAFT_425590 [Hypoxylon trugodes]KAI1392381.1 hypothetical protein F4822DRAFT_425590 [Hypoxylon trugodes]